MSTYILSIVGAVLISAVITMICPSGKMGRFVKGAMKLFTLVVLIAPFVGWLRGGTLGGADFGGKEFSEDTAYFAQCAELLERSDEDEIAGLILQTFGVQSEVSVVRKHDATFAYEKIAVKISDSVISGQVEHKDITDRVQAFLAEKYGSVAEVS